MTDATELSLEERASLTSGLNFWYTKPVERAGVPSIMMTDGPHGLRKQAGSGDHLGVGASVPATCFPPAVGLGSSWDVELVTRVGAALGVAVIGGIFFTVLGTGQDLASHARAFAVALGCNVALLAVGGVLSLLLPKGRDTF